MEPSKLIIITFHLLFTRLHTATVEAAHFENLNKISDLAELCPYSSFCGQNASSTFPLPDVYSPCCQSCSCDPECGLRRDCCFGELDKYNIGKDNMICRHTFVVESITNEERYKSIVSASYRMINKCDVNHIVSETNDTACEHNSSDIKEPFHPMYSPYTGKIYINAYCAMCNNISDAVPWKRALICPQNAETTLSDYFEHFVSGKVSTNYPGCLSFYIPPTDVDLSSESCYLNVIRECNITGKLKEKNKYWNRCKMLNATFITQSSRVAYAYANVYCYLCNLEITKQPFDSKNCKTTVLPSEDKTQLTATLTIILKIPEGSQQDHVSRKVVRKTSHCPLGSVVVNSFTKSCRKRKCPVGQLLINNHCDYYATQWIGGPFAVMLRLSTLNGNPSLPTSFFKEMTAEQKYDNRAGWIKRKSLRRWNLRVMYHPSDDHKTVEYMVVKASYPTKQVDPHFLRKSVMTAFQDKWEIVNVNTSIYFSVSLNEHTEYHAFYKQFLLKIGINVSFNYGYFPKRKTCLGLTIYDNKYNLFVFPIFDIVEKAPNVEDGFFITKLFFCNQVGLLPDEYEYTPCSSIFFKVKNVTLDTYSTVNLPNDNIPNNDSVEFSKNHLPRIYVCLHEFEWAANVGAGVSFCIYGLISMICMVKFISK